MTTAREQILHDIRRNLPLDESLPPLAGPWTRYDDPHAKFLEMIPAVGGAGQVVDSDRELRVAVEQIATQLEAKRIASVFPEIAPGNVDLATIDDPHQLADVDLAILPGELAVAENAAVWVTADRVSERVLYFLSQHVILIVPSDAIVHNMHEAYEWLANRAGPRGLFPEARWGAFMSGPSKTADIEQALVIGAHGARSLNVLFTPP